MTTMRPESTWSIHRMDDHGNEYLVLSGLSREDAERMLAHYTERGHKQTYTIQEQKGGWQEVRAADDRIIGYTKGDEFRPVLMTCPKCGARGAAFICNRQGCPVNGGAAYG